MDNINFSIIIPHYNVPKLLARCLYTIPQRDDLEVIVVDDNSNPDIVDFDNFPGKDRPNTRIILDKKGGGGGYARNKGLEVARGKWVLFSDSDDYFTYCFNDMLDKYANSEADVVYFKTLSCDTEYYTPALKDGGANRYIDITKTDKVKGEFLLKYTFVAPWSKLIKREIIVKNNIHFDEVPVCNDGTFAYLVGYYAKAIEVEEHAIYISTIRQGSVSAIFTDDKKLIRIEVYSRGESFLRSHNVDITINYQYNDLYDFLIHRKYDLFRKGFNIVKKYIHSDQYIYYRILRLVPHKIWGKERRVFASVLKKLHLI